MAVLTVEALVAWCYW